MNASEYDLLRSVEDHHWWHRVLRGQVMRVVNEKLKGAGRLLDAGCGTGGMLRHLQKHAPCLVLSGVDRSQAAVRHCHERCVPALEATLHALPFEAGFFDMILCLDVLYHQNVEEHQALAEMNRVLKSGGWLVLNLPAFNCLRGSHDDAVQGARRYQAAQVRSMLASHGFDSDESHYWNAWPFLPRLAWRQLSRLHRSAPQTLKSDLAAQPAWLASLLHSIGFMDAQACKSLRIPFGSSVFTVARKACIPDQGGCA